MVAPSQSTKTLKLAVVVGEESSRGGGRTHNLGLITRKVVNPQAESLSKLRLTTTRLYEEAQRNKKCNDSYS